MSPEEQAVLQYLLGGSSYIGYGQTGAMVSLPHMSPNNNNILWTCLFAPQFSTHVKDPVPMRDRIRYTDYLFRKNKAQPSNNEEQGNQL